MNRKHRYLLAGIAVFFVLASAVPPVSAGKSALKWVRQVGSSVDDMAIDAAVDADGNVYITGYSAAIDGQPYSGGTDAFLSKYGPDGTRLWTRLLGTPLSQEDQSRGVAIDGSGTIYIAGYTTGSFPGYTCAGTHDIFLAKYDPSGNLLDVWQTGSAADDRGTALCIDTAGYLYVGGITYGDLDGNTAAGNADMFLMKFDGSGNKLWTRQMGSSAEDKAWAVAADGDDRVYVAGLSYGSIGVNQNAGSADIILARYDASGNRVWVSEYGTTHEDVAYGVAVDTNSNVYVSGCTYGSLDGNVNPGTRSDIFLSRYGADGSRHWTRQFGTDGDDFGYRIAINNSGNVYVAGSIAGGMDGNAGSGGRDLALFEFDTGGAMLSVSQTGSTGDDGARCVAGDGKGNLYAAGHAGGSVEGLTYAGMNDILLVRWRPRYVPRMSWSGDTGYVSDGVEPNIGYPDTVFRYRFVYADDNNAAPAAGYPRVHVKREGNAIEGSPFVMSGTDADAVYTDGKTYACALTLGAGGEYSYVIEALDVDGDGPSVLPADEAGGPAVVAGSPGTGVVKVLHGVFKPGEGEQCYVSCTPASAGGVTMRVFDGLGREVRKLYDAPANAGPLTVAWNGRDRSGNTVPSGVYVIRVEGPGFTARKRVVVVR